MDKSLILSKIKEYLGIRTDKDFADFLGIKPTALAMWYKRNTFDIETIFKKCEGISAEWLLTGEGSMLRTQENASIVNTGGKNVNIQGSENTRVEEQSTDLLEIIKEQSKQINEKDKQIEKLLNLLGK